MTTLHDFGGVLGRPLDTFFWALTISWSRLLAGVMCEAALSKYSSVVVIGEEPLERLQLMDRGDF